MEGSTNRVDGGLTREVDAESRPDRVLKDGCVALQSVFLLTVLAIDPIAIWLI
jgi:hypothetical protein